jgi:hypothetical protein
MMAIPAEANQIFRPVTTSDDGIDGEVEFKDNDSMRSGMRIDVQLKSGNSYLRMRESRAIPTIGPRPRCEPLGAFTTPSRQKDNRPDSPGC